MKKYLISLLMLLGIAACARNPHPPVKTTMDPAHAEATTAAFLATRQAETAMPLVTVESGSFVMLTAALGDDITIWKSAGETPGQILARVPDQSVVQVLDVIVLDDGNTWYQVSFDGIIGWVAADFVRKLVP